MLLNSKGFALLLATSISLITFAFLYLLDKRSATILVVALVVSFAAAFILIYTSLEFLIFKEIQNIYSGIDKINRKEFKSYSEQIIQSSKNPLKRVNQEIAAYAARKQQEIEELRKLETFRREFIADVSHELKTPIFAAQGFVLTLLDGAVEDENVRYKFLKKAAKSLEGLNLLVQDLLVLSQLESGDLTMQLDIIDIQDLTQDVFEQLEEKAAKKQIQLQIKNPQQAGVYITADPIRMTQVMTNLVLNGIKYGNENGFVAVSFAEDEQKILVSVEDNGIGIPKEHIKRIFDRFYRVEKSRSKKQGGTGLGLAIVKHILEKHNAKIAVSSVFEKSSIFSFKIDRGVPDKVV
jgi:two-component system, OmpR family, phosphate regulon sensor histidine kinase PhoR